MFIEQIALLLKQRGITQKEMLEACGLNKNNMGNWKKGVAPSPATIKVIADFFKVPVEVLTGETEELITAKAMGEVVEWLEDNDYEVSTDEQETYCIGKNGEYVYYSNADFATESLAIKATAQEGFELAMCDWERKNFSDTQELSEQEKTLLRMFRETTEEGRLEMISSFMNIRKEVEKKNHIREDSANVG